MGEMENTTNLNEMTDFNHVVFLHTFIHRIQSTLISQVKEEPRFKEPVPVKCRGKKSYQDLHLNVCISMINHILKTG